MGAVWEPILLSLARRSASRVFKSGTGEVGHSVARWSRGSGGLGASRISEGFGVVGFVRIPERGCAEAPEQDDEQQGGREDADRRVYDGNRRQSE